MSNLRALATFLVLIIVVLLAVFQMRLRGYEKVERINEYVLYKDIDYDCKLVHGDAYDLDCAEMYIVKSGFYEVTIEDALLEELITEAELSPYVDYLAD
jgi:hypothetical protein